MLHEKQKTQTFMKQRIFAKSFFFLIQRGKIVDVLNFYQIQYIVEITRRGYNFKLF